MSNPVPSGVYNIAYISTVWNLLVPPDKRQPVFLDWGGAVMASKQWKGDAIFGSYANGAQVITPYFNSALSYSVGDRVIFGIRNDGHGHFGDNAVYECISSNLANSIPPNGTNVVPDVPPAYVVDSKTALVWLATGNNGIPFYWVKVQDNFIGAIVRCNYNSQTMVFTYLLNVWFNTTFRQPNGGAIDPGSNPTGTSDIYIQTNDNLDAQFMMGPISSTSQSYMAPASPPAVYYMPYSATALSLTDFTIYVPTDVYNSLNGDSTTKTNTISSFANLINATGMTYSIATY